MIAITPNGESKPANLATFAPYKWKLGAAGKDESEIIYARCCKCESEDLTAALFSGDVFNFHSILVIPEGYLYRMAVFCAEHAPK